MRCIISLLFITCINLISLGQIVEDAYINRVDSITKSYNWYKDSSIKIKTKDQKLLTFDLNKAFSNIILGSNLSSEASSFSYSQNQEKTNIKASFGFFRDSLSINPWLLSLTLSANGSNNIFSLYRQETWQSNIGLNLSFIKKNKFWAGSFRYTSNDNKIKFGIDSLSRRAHLLAARNEFFTFHKPTNKKLLIEKLNSRRHKTINQIEILALSDTSKIVQIDSLTKLFNQQTDSLEKLQLSKLSLDEYLSSVVQEFDKNHDITSGYYLSWWRFDVGLFNSTYNFEESDIDTMVLSEFKSTHNLNDNINRLKLNLGISFNFISSKRRILKYYSLGLKGQYGSILENNLINGELRIEDSLYNVKDENDNIFGQYNGISNLNSWTGSFEAYVMFLFGEKKSLGFDATFRHSVFLKRNVGIYEKTNFTGLIGPIFRKSKNDNADLVFGIQFGWLNAPYLTRINDEWITQLKIGIPITVSK